MRLAALVIAAALALPSGAGAGGFHGHFGPRGGGMDFAAPSFAPLRGDLPPLQGALPPLRGTALGVPTTMIDDGGRRLPKRHRPKPLVDPGFWHPGQPAALGVVPATALNAPAPVRSRPPVRPFVWARDAAGSGIVKVHHGVPPGRRVSPVRVITVRP